MLKTIAAALFLATAAVWIGACSPHPEAKNSDRPLATINDYRLSLGTFQRELASELELEKDYKLTEQAKREFLDSLINKELLIQEAVRRKLDRQEAFVKAIEKYWESTLIRDLLSLKGREISAAITVTQEEIEARYHTLQQASPEIGPLTDEMQAQLRQELKAAKKSKQLSAWIDQLRSQAAIEIDEALLASE